jgi:hypothetical protein
MKDIIEKLMSEVDSLAAKTAAEAEEHRIRLLGKKRKYYRFIRKIS